MVEDALHRVGPPGLVVGADQPLIGLIFEEDGREVVRYFADEFEADADWDELADSLDRIRHEREPTL